MNINVIKLIRLAVMLVAVVLMQMGQLPAQAASLCHPCDHKIVCQSDTCEEIVYPGECVVYDTSGQDAMFTMVEGLYGSDPSFVDVTVAEREGNGPGGPGCSSAFRVEDRDGEYRASGTIDVSGKLEAQVYNLEGNAPIFVTLDAR